jgi:hypothetical protein
MEYYTEAIYRQIYVTSLLATFNHVYPLHDCPHFIVICMIVSWPGIFIIYRLVLHIYTHPYTRVSNIYLHSVRHWRRRQDSNLIFQLHNFPAFEFFQIFVKLLFLGFTCAITYKNTQNRDTHWFWWNFHAKIPSFSRNKFVYMCRRLEISEVGH